jgi:hypothetical protein
MTRWFLGAIVVGVLLAGCAAAPGRGRQTAEREPPTAAQPRPETPAEDLKRDGVITPPAIGDEAAVKQPPPEDVGRTPVIKPPGTPGGDPNVKPK